MILYIFIENWEDIISSQDFIILGYIGTSTFLIKKTLIIAMTFFFVLFWEKRQCRQASSGF